MSKHQNEVDVCANCNRRRAGEDGLCGVCHAKEEEENLKEMETWDEFSSKPKIGTHVKYGKC